MENTDSALEQFRRQWKEEVRARTKDSKEKQVGDHNAVSAGPSEHTDVSMPLVPPPRLHPETGLQEDKSTESSRDRKSDQQNYELSTTLDRWTLGTADDDEFFSPTAKEPESALEHYERAVEKESQGNLGDSLSHYRKAYRLDAHVDQSYKHKHFPPESRIPVPDPSNASVTVPSTAHHSWKDLPEHASIPTLVASFARAPIHGAPPVIAGDRAPACPMNRLPSEILFEILLSTAILDPASFARLAMVCKRLAYHVLTENQIWKRVALGPEFGLAGQRYDFETDVQGREAINRALNAPHERSAIDKLTLDDSMSQDWREVFHSHPRIRFTGVYISTVKYTRAGAASVTQATWNSPVHIVTYYRYLRFFRDGTVISLLSTNQPIEVVHHLTRENVAFVRGSKEYHPLGFTSSATAINGSGQTVPPAAHQLMKHVLRGRWRLRLPSAAKDHNIADVTTAGVGTEGDLHIETEGVGPRYMYTMWLTLRSSGKSKQGVKNNKLQWKSFWSYNQLTNDWAPFQLKIDRPFFFSRVKSYGLGHG